MPSPFDQDNPSPELPASDWPTQPEWPAPAATPTASYPPPGPAPQPPPAPRAPNYPPPGTTATPASAWGPAPATPPVWQAPPAGPPMGPPPVPPAPGQGGQPPRRSKLTSKGSRIGLAVAVIVALLIGAAGGGVAAKSIFTSAVDTAAPPTTGSGAGTGGSTTPTNPTSPTTPNQGSGGSATLSSWDEVVAKVTVGVVNIESRMPQGVGAGTGMVLSADGEILTNNHVVEGASAIVVTVVTTGESYRATIVGTAPEDDVAVLQLTGASGLETIPLGDSDAVRVGDQVAAIGNAGGDGGEPSVATGRVTALDQQITASDQDGSNAETLTDMIQVDANVVPGDSGGPLANTSGEVIGMDSAASVSAGRLGGPSRSRSGSGTTSGGGEGYAIPINKALSIAEELKRTHANADDTTDGSGSSTGSGAFLGVQVQAASTGGAEVVAVQSGSPAAAAGLSAGATIVGIDDTQIEDADALVAALADHEPGDRVTVTWLDSSGRTQRSTATLAG